MWLAMWIFICVLYTCVSVHAYWDYMLSLGPGWTWECGTVVTSPLLDYQMCPLCYKVLTSYEHWFNLISTKEFLICL